MKIAIRIMLSSVMAYTGQYNNLKKDNTRKRKEEHTRTTTAWIIIGNKFIGRVCMLCRSVAFLREGIGYPRNLQLLAVNTNQPLLSPQSTYHSTWPRHGMPKHWSIDWSCFRWPLAVPFKHFLGCIFLSFHC